MDSKFFPELAEVESEVIDVDKLDEGGGEAFLVGRLVTEKNWNCSNLIEVIREAWKMKHGGMSWREWGVSKLILFRFDDVMDRDWVLKHQPWLFRGSLLAIKEFTGGNEQHLSSLDNVTVEHASFWARLYEVPTSFMNERSLRLFAKQIGVLESVDKSDEDSVGRFLRFKISVNITTPLMRGITIRAKGKHLWLPLKYESLPIYCFCCGTIGHDCNSCRSCNNRNLEYSACKLRAPSSKGRKKIEQHHLPLDVLENILSRVPVKYLLRFKAVCKQWKATISDPRFAEIHLQQYKKPSSKNLLLAWEELDEYKGFYVASFRYRFFSFVSTIKHSREYYLMEGVKSSCDGLYLKLGDPYGMENMYVLWNLSCRAYKEILCPQPIYYLSRENLTGIYYNALVKDYKVVIADNEHYAVFSCRDNKWSKVKRMKYYSQDDEPYRGHGVSSYSDKPWSGVPFDGSFYWLIKKREKEQQPRHHPPPWGLVDDVNSQKTVSELKIICFDGKEEKFKKLSVPDCEGIAYWVCLSSSGGHLCLLGKGLVDEVFVLKKVNGDEKDSWMEFKIRLGTIAWDFAFWVSENEFVLDLGPGEEYYRFDLIERTYVDVIKIESRGKVNPHPYLENLFLQ